jgi:hypothetical protein
MIVARILMTAALALAPIPSGAQTLSKSDFVDRDVAPRLERPQDAAPFLTRAHILTAILAADRAAVTPEAILLWNALDSGQGCADLESLDKGLLDRQAVLEGILERGVSRPREVSAVGSAGIELVAGKYLALERSDLSAIGMPGIDQGYCHGRRLSLGEGRAVKSISAEFPETIPTFNLGPVENAALMTAARENGPGTPEVCVQAVITDIRAEKAGPGSYDVTLEVGALRIGATCATEVSVGAGVAIRPMMLERFEDYIATLAPDPETGALRWGRESVEIGPDGRPAFAFEPL